MDSKRIYSLNLITFIYMETDLEPIIESEDGVTYYAIFPFCHAIDVAIEQYRMTRIMVDLHKFIRCYKQIRQLIRSKREENKNV